MSGVRAAVAEADRQIRGIRRLLGVSGVPLHPSGGARGPEADGADLPPLWQARTRRAPGPLWDVPGVLRLPRLFLSRERRRRPAARPGPGAIRRWGNPAGAAGARRAVPGVREAARAPAGSVGAVQVLLGLSAVQGPPAPQTGNQGRIGSRAARPAAALTSGVD